MLTLALPLSVAAGGNVTGGVGQLAQNATVAYLQELGTNQVKQIADNLGSEESRAALHAIVGCAGAAASSQSCGAGAMGAAASSVLGSLLAPSANLSASEREARDNLVTSLVAGIAAVSGQDVATATGAGKIEVENNQVAPMAPVPGWLAGFKLPGYKGETAAKGDGVIADPVTELDPSAKAGPLIAPNSGPKVIEALITAAVPQWIKNLLSGGITADGRLVIDTKIADQLGERGWTESDIQAAIKNGATGTSIDKRSATKSPDGVARNDPATVYGTPNGYVVVNDRTGEVVQVSNKRDPGWIADGRISWKDAKGR
nr:colicin E5-related ribonuclease [Burkholderia ubonensis]